MTEQVQQKREMTEQENERDLDELEWIKRHGVRFLQSVLWELGLDEEPEETLIEVLTTVHAETGLYVFDAESARSFASDCEDVDIVYNQRYASARQERINARRKRKLEAVDDEDSVPW